MRPSKNYAGYIFDCDGTLADTMPLHYKAWCHALRACGGTFDFSYELMCSWGGKSISETIRDLNAMHGTELDPRDAHHHIGDYIHEHLPHVEPREHIVEIARELALKAPVSVASGGNRLHVHTTLQAIGLRDLFEVVVTAEDVIRSKPAPDIFLLAAEKMGVEPTQCLVYEDSPMGERGAHEAGMDCILVD